MTPDAESRSLAVACGPRPGSPFGTQQNGRQLGPAGDHHQRPLGPKSWPPWPIRFQRCDAADHIGLARPCREVRPPCSGLAPSGERQVMPTAYEATFCAACRPWPPWWAEAAQLNQLLYTSSLLGVRQRRPLAGGGHPAAARDRHGEILRDAEAVLFELTAAPAAASPSGGWGRFYGTRAELAGAFPVAGAASARGWRRAQQLESTG